MHPLPTAVSNRAVTASRAGLHDSDTGCFACWALGLVFKSQVKWGLLEAWRPKIATLSRMLALQKNACWFLKPQSKAPKEERERWHRKETMSLLSYREPPAQTGETMAVIRMEKGFYFLQDTAMGGEC